MDKIAIAMITTDRSKNQRRNYIFDTLESLEKSGVFSSKYYDSLTIHIDGASHPYKSEILKRTKHLPNVIVKQYTDIAGSAGNALRAHNDLYEKNVEWAMVMEDDIRVCSDFLFKIFDWLKEAYSTQRLVYQIGVWKEYVDKLAPASNDRYFDFYGHDETNPKVFSSTRPTTHMRGSQCYLMERRHCASFAFFLDNYMFEQKTTRLIHHDQRIRQWLNDVAKKSEDVLQGYLRAPKPKTFVQHIGKESAVYDVKKHIDPSFYSIED